MILNKYVVANFPFISLHIHLVNGTQAQWNGKSPKNSELTSNVELVHRFSIANTS